MAGYKYVTILTDIGKQKLAGAISAETPLDFTEMAVGDANGVGYEPTSDMTSLKHETYRAAIGSLKIDEIDKNIMIFEFVVPASSGGYYMREAGLFASDGTMIAIARIAEQYKPLVSEGAGSSITISMRIAVSSEAQVYINIPESISYATQTYVNEELKKHIADSNPHNQYVLNETYSSKIEALQENINGKAAANHTHSDYAASNHNHDDVYSKTNHTHTGYAASSHSHAFSAITGSMAITDKRLTGNLPVARVIGAAVASKFYYTSSGFWIETTLSNGKVLLEGGGREYYLKSSEDKIVPPKTVESFLETNISAAIGQGEPFAITTGFGAVCLRGDKGSSCNWSMKAILA